MAAISIRLPDEVSERLQNLAAVTGRTKTYYATEAIVKHLDDLEDLYISEHRWRELQEGRSKTVPFSEIAGKYVPED